MKNKKMCDNCTFWKATELGHVGACKVQLKATKWSDTCREYIRFIKEVKKANDE